MGETEVYRGLSPPIAARPIATAAPLPKPSLALEYSAMEPDSDDKLVQEIQSVLATTEPHAKKLSRNPFVSEFIIDVFGFVVVVKRRGREGFRSWSSGTCHCPRDGPDRRCR